MARRIRNANPVTLFPFLAVLMCTIGALVLLLVVISAQIRGSAVQQFVAEHQKKTEPAQAVSVPPLIEETVADPEPVRVEPIVVDVQEPASAIPPEPPVARIPPPIPASDEQLATIEALKSQAVALKSKFADAVEELDGLTQKRSALDRQLKAVVAQEADLKKSLQQAVAVSTVAGQKLASLNVENRQIIELLEQSDELIKSERKRVSTPRHSLIPYDGQTGTIRKPIVIECAAGTIRFEAEDVELDVKRLEEYPPGVNPLVAGIQTLFAYWTEQARAAGRSGVAARPYALLIVRPSGAKQFQLARVLLQPLVGDYGYEFVEESFAYDVPATTDEAARKCREAVAVAFQMKPRGPGVGSPIFEPGGGGGDRPNGGIVLPRGPIDVERLTQQPAASRGFFSSGNFRRRLTGESAGEGLGGSFASEDGAAGRGSGLPSGSRDTQPETGTGYSAEAADGSQGASRQAIAARAAETAAEQAGSLASRAEPTVGKREVGADGDDGQAGGASQAEAGSGGVVRGSAAGSQSARATQGGGRATLEPALRDDTPDSRRETNSTVAEFLKKARAIRERQQQAGGSTATAAGESANGNAQAAGNSTGPVVGTASSRGDSEATSQADASAAGAESPGDSSQAGSSGGELDASGPGAPSFSKSLNRKSQRGEVQKRWGKSGPNATLGLERPVTIVVGQSRVLIVDAYQITPKPEWSEVQTVNVCLKGLDMTANDWGMPGEKYYWVPVVTLRVEDGSESLGQLLEKSLERLGVVVEHEPTFLEPGRRN